MLAASCSVNESSFALAVAVAPGGRGELVRMITGLLADVKTSRLRCGTCRCPGAEGTGLFSDASREAASLGLAGSF